MAEIRRKRFAAHPGVREQICNHHHAPYSGAIPCTGPRVCTMCGMRFYSGADLAEARQKAREAAEKERQEGAA